MSRGAFRPHMAQRPGETPEEHRARLTRSCYRCGEEIDDLDELSAHEDTHGSAPRARS
ncbi:hypothetical protein [Saccharopolyspora cebuensis]|uniref:C2H2-type domain-containing protein n=1 Tax=Saccharopolyspora cebuensis TaxID=418759 RepID=A0ABV4CJH6_9PSEU